MNAPRLPDQEFQEDVLAVLDEIPIRLEPPKPHQVLLLNDDYTPMEFVVWVLQEFFGKTQEEATQIMLSVHTRGRGICGVYTPDVAQSKVKWVMQAAQEALHPLQCISEPIN